MKKALPRERFSLKRKFAHSPPEPITTLSGEFFCEFLLFLIVSRKTDADNIIATL